jgi:hypothetical protein
MLMIKKLLFLAASVLFLPIALSIPDRKNKPLDIQASPPVEMPKLLDDPFANRAYGGVPQEQRDPQFNRWLAVSLKVSVSGGSGSGTIIYYDPADGFAYVQSCGHLWNGNMSAEEGKRKKITCKVTTWYKNEQKLGQPQTYNAEVLYYHNPDPNDASLLRFQPDWVPNYVPVAPVDFRAVDGMRLRSCGCDGGREVAHYDVRLLGTRGTDFVTTENSPRSGRSGGGLMTDDHFIGICSRSSDPSGTIGRGNGYFTGISAIRSMNEKNGYGWLNEVGINWARQIPIIDRNSPQKNHPKDYIPIPKTR